MEVNMLCTSLMLLMVVSSTYADSCLYTDPELYDWKPISSRNFEDNSYKSLPYVCWTFKGNKGERRIQVRFSSFEIGPANQTDCSNGGYLAIHNGLDRSAGQLGRWCGTNGPVEVNSTVSTMYIELHFPDYDKYSGFTANIKEFWIPDEAFSSFAQYIPIIVGVGFGIAAMIILGRCVMRRKAQQASRAAGGMNNMHPVPGTLAQPPPRPPPGGVYNTAYGYSAQQGNVYSGEYAKQHGNPAQPPPYMSQPSPAYPS